MSRLPFVEGFCRGLALGLVALTLLASSAHAETWRRVAEVPAVEITVSVLESKNAMRAARHKFGRAPVDRVYRSELKGFSVLWQSKSDGVYRCTIYLSAADDVETLEHERRHCNGWTH